LGTLGPATNAGLDLDVVGTEVSGLCRAAVHPG
jgi:hypothetical protein